MRRKIVTMLMVLAGACMLHGCSKLDTLESVIENAQGDDIGMATTEYEEIVVPTSTAPVYIPSGPVIRQDSVSYEIKDGVLRKYIETYEYQYAPDGYLIGTTHLGPDCISSTIIEGAAPGYVLMNPTQLIAEYKGTLADAAKFQQLLADENGKWHWQDANELKDLHYNEMSEIVFQEGREDAKGVEFLMPCYDYEYEFVDGELIVNATKMVKVFDEHGNQIDKREPTEEEAYDLFE